MTAIFDKLKEQYPGLIVTEDRMDSGNVWYGLNHRCKYITIEHRLNDGYGLYLKDDCSLGSGPDEVVQEEQLNDRLIEFFKPTKAYERCL